MTDQIIVNWKTITCQNIFGENYESRIPQIVDSVTRRTLLTNILSMAKKNPISLAVATKMINEKQDEAFSGRKFGNIPGHLHWYLYNFVNWISEQGYHIELTGDEFEPLALSDKVS